jgi:hypothetical protein
MVAFPLMDCGRRYRAQQRAGLHSARYDRDFSSLVPGRRRQTFRGGRADLCRFGKSS